MYISFEHKYQKYLSKNINYGGGYPKVIHGYKNKLKDKITFVLFDDGDSELILYDVKDTKFENKIYMTISVSFPFGGFTLNGINYNFDPPPNFDKLYQLIVNNNFFTRYIDIKNNKIANALIYCHPRKWEDKEPHYWKSSIENIVTNNITNPSNVTFLTLDNKPNGKQDFIADGFGDLFINNNENKFDYVFLPDCGGLWYELQIDKKMQEFINLIIKVLKIVRNGGLLVLSKILLNELLKKEDDAKELCDLLKSLSPEIAKCNYTIEKGPGIVMIIQKN
jgi:hypothetical protein